MDTLITTATTWTDITSIDFDAKQPFIICFCTRMQVNGLADLRVMVDDSMIYQYLIPDTHGKPVDIVEDNLFYSPSEPSVLNITLQWRVKGIAWVDAGGMLLLASEDMARARLAAIAYATGIFSDSEST